VALGIASSGQHGLDFKDGELRLSVLRSSAYCHERGFDLEKGSQWKFADIGVHEFRLLVTAGVPASVKAMMPGLADHLASPPAVFPHLPYDPRTAPPVESLLSLKPVSVRLLACKRSWDGEALVVRLQEAVGRRSKAVLRVARSESQERGHVPEVHVPLSFKPFEIKTLRVERDGAWAEVPMIEEQGDNPSPRRRWISPRRSP
jgi:alpha-mannosidase